MITSRDLEIIRLLDAQGLATHRQLSTLFFKTDGAARTRLSLLNKSGIVNLVPIEKYLENYRTIKSELLTIGSKDSVYVLGTGISKYRESAISVDLIKHNLLCNDVYIRIKDALGIKVSSFSFEKFERKTFSELNPDITLIGNDFKLGIEVERTLKRSNSRYYKKFSHYYYSDYTHILYTCLNKEIHKQVTRLARDFKFIGSTQISNETLIISHNQDLHNFLNTQYKK